MRQFMLVAGLGFAALAADAARRSAGGSTALPDAVSGGAPSDIDRTLVGGCHPRTAGALRSHDPAVAERDTVAGRDARWRASFHGCEEVLTLLDEAPAPMGAERQPERSER
jgi:hypothetical protein